LGLYDVPVTNSNTRKAFDQGVIHMPDTAFPWDQENEKNVFLAGHRLGEPGEEDSRLVFYHLDELKPKDEIVLKDRRGRSYKYRVKELFKVEPDDAWVADTLVGRDLLTLTTYTLPNLEDRIVVRADRVQEDPGQDPDRIQQRSSRRSDPDRQPNPVVKQDSKGQQDSVRRQDSARKQDSTRQPNSGPKKKRRK
jgi:LPXTG-site transpeptidase (sortase) family protein